MANLALYRKWRPRTFDEVVEQGHVVRTLKNAVANDRLAHAYLFCGTRGTGKTSLAQILSRAVNCLSPEGANPCNRCEICTGILAGRVMDVVEIDAASNNGVDNIRRLREDIVYAPVSARHKVYIIDEVHMLSGGAFNALLKTLEEPPEYAMFILATTEPHKLPATILSRCQRFDFRRITNRAIAERLALIAKDVGVAVGDDALTLIARLADGALRDAISILDQCVAMAGDSLSREDVARVAGLTGDELLSQCAGILVRRQTRDVPAHVSALFASGRDAAQYVSGLIGYFRNMMALEFGVSEDEFPEIPAESLQQMRALAREAGLSWIFAVITELSAFEGAIKTAQNQSVLLEVELAKICLGTFHAPDSMAALQARVDRLERELDAARRGAGAA